MTKPLRKRVFIQDIRRHALEGAKHLLEAALELDLYEKTDEICRDREKRIESLLAGGYHRSKVACDEMEDMIYD